MDSKYWSVRYQNKETGWDLGATSPPLIEIFKTIDKTAKILIPGCGNAYEASFLFNKGYKNVFIIDIAIEPLREFELNNVNFPKQQILHEDYFAHHGAYDVIIEQTFFCAIEPIFRTKYIEKSHELLNEKGILTGLLFNCSFDGGPPFGGERSAYAELFEKKFRHVSIKPCKTSIKPRLGMELLLRCEK